MQTAPGRRSGHQHTLAEDAGRYLELVGPLVSLVNRRQEIGVWLPRFGHLCTLSLPDHVNALNAQLREWRAHFAASTVNHRRNALTNLVKVLYGRRAAAELIDLERFKAPPPKPRWIDREHIADVLNQLSAGTKTAPRLWLMHWTGMRPSQMGRLNPDDFRLDETIPFVAIPSGKGGNIATVPLIAEALETVRAFIDADAFGAWSCPSANKALEKSRRTGRPRTVHGLPDPTLVPERTATHRNRSRGHQEHVRTHEHEDHRDLRTTGHRQAPRINPASSKLRNANGANTGSLAETGSARKIAARAMKPGGEKARKRLAHGAGSQVQKSGKSLFCNG